MSYNVKKYLKMQEIQQEIKDMKEVEFQNKLNRHKTRQSIISECLEKLKQQTHLTQDEKEDNKRFEGLETQIQQEIKQTLDEYDRRSLIRYQAERNVKEQILCVRDYLKRTGIIEQSKREIQNQQMQYVSPILNMKKLDLATEISQKRQSISNDIKQLKMQRDEAKSNIARLRQESTLSAKNPLYDIKTEENISLNFSKESLTNNRQQMGSLVSQSRFQNFSSNFSNNYSKILSNKNLYN
ncbi:protoporphyrinogen oxidase family protein (macronuclear) [Tetrahymena thermophila SB210]|uniref:Protoporphyrinogen oxidase family protein n=1 Tax=Tetrahymena thermophila (strain SB210) TaxID=312017 RepID=W7XLB2_TETTS|nr:protoporphyrinogen oxidase family protein [Tetrahymena thermophila SB210]EWS75984.1 protoporphyrinogen oxidase family protein [Tetrahymena thermophila SB210]|eukprot:XP_012651502.1 protoporphyrinogen oxidase family protein [Tetrahymena thermophila SB210]